MLFSEWRSMTPDISSYHGRFAMTPLPFSPARLVLPSFLLFCGLLIGGAGERVMGQVVAFGGGMVGQPGPPMASWDLDEVLDLAEEKIEQAMTPNRKRALRRAMLRVERVDLICKLTDAQRRRLEVAAKGLAAKKCELDYSVALQNVQRMIEQYHQMAQPKMTATRIIEQYIRGQIHFGRAAVTGAGSPEAFWERAVAKTLSPEQLAEYRKARGVFEDKIRASLVDLVLAWTQRQLQLTPDQVGQLRPLVTQAIGTTYWFRQFTSEDPQNFYFTIQPLQVLSQIPRSKTRAILRPTQWQVLQDFTKRQQNGMRGMIELAADDDAADDAEENDKKKDGKKKAKPAKNGKSAKGDRKGDGEKGTAAAARAEGKGKADDKQESDKKAGRANGPEKRPTEEPADDPFG